MSSFGSRQPPTPPPPSGHRAMKTGVGDSEDPINVVTQTG